MRFLFVCEVNIAFPILLVNRKSDLNIEKPIFVCFYALIDKRKPTLGGLEFVMSKNTEELEIAVIPKGSRVSIMGCSYLLLKDAKVDGSQTYLNDALKAQANHYKGIDLAKPKDGYITIHSPTKSVKVKRSEVAD